MVIKSTPLLPNWVHEEHLESTSSQPQDACNTDAPESSGNLNPTATSTNPPADQLERLTVETPIPTVSLPIPTVCFTKSQEPSNETRLISKRVANQVETPSLDNILTLTNWFEDILGVTSNEDESNGVEADVSNMETTITASPTPTLRIHRDHPKSQIIGPVDTPIQTRNKSKEVLKNKKDERGIVIRNKARLVAQGHTQEDGIDYDEVFAPVARIKAIRLSLAYASFMGFTVYQMDVKSAFLYGTIDEEVYVMQPPRFQDPKYPARVYKVEKAMYGLHQALRAWYVARIEAIRLFLAYASFIGFIVYQMDVKSTFLYGTIDEEVYVMQPPGFQDPEFPTSSQPQDACNTDAHESSGNSNPTATLTNLPADQLETLTVETPIPTISSPVPTFCFTDSQEPSSETRLISKRVTNQAETPSLDNILTLSNQFEDILGVITNSKESSGVEADVWSLVDCPKGVRHTGTKWVLKNKKDERGIVIRNKARLVAQGHTQEERIDYNELFAPVARIKAIRLFLAYASFLGFIVYQIDVKSAFLYATINEEVYVIRPPGQDPEYPARVYKVEKAMYGLHQAPRAWYGRLSKYLLTNGFKRGTIDQTLSIRRQTGYFIIVQVYVDDIIFGSSNPHLCREFEALMHEKFQMSDMDVRSLNTPMDMENPWGKDGTGKDVDLHLYRSMIGSLMYLTASRPDIRLSMSCKNLSKEISRSILRFPKLIPLVSKGYVTMKAYEPASPVRDSSQGEACPTDSGFIADQDRATIAKSSTLPHDSAPRVTSPVADEGTQEVEINQLKESVKQLEEREGVAATNSGDDALKGEEVVDVLTSSGSIPTASTPAEGSVPTSSREVPIASPVFSTATVVTPVTRRKGKEVMAESETPKKQKVQEQIDAQVARELKEQLSREDQRRAKQIAKDVEIARTHSQQRKSWTKKQKSNYYMVVIRNNLGWKVKDFRGMTFEEVKGKFNSVCKQIEDFIPMGSNEEAKNIKRKGINLEQESAKKQKSSEEITEEAKSPKEVHEEKVKEMMNLVPIEENFMHALVDWKLYDSCGVHHVAAKDKEIFMLVEKDYPLSKGLALVMICYKLQVENFSQMANELVLKIYRIANSPRKQEDPDLSYEHKPQDHCSTEVPEGSGNLSLTASTSNPPADQMETLTVETPIPTASLPVLTAYSTNSHEPSSDARLISKRVANQVETPSLDNILSLTNRFEDILGVSLNLEESNGGEADISNMETAIIASPTPTLRNHKDHPKSQIIGPVDTSIQTKNKSKENVWTLVDCPKGVRPIRTKWVLKNKKDERGIVIRNKARLVAQRHTQEERIDYDEDSESPAKVYKVEKAMYGLHQALRSWYGTLSKYLLKNGFQRGIIDQTLFIRRQRGDFILVQVYVDDIIFGSSNPQLCKELEALMHEKFQMSAIGELNFFLGLQVLQKEDDIFLSQDKYVGDILKKFRYLEVRSSNTPIDKENPWGKDKTRKDVDLHLYRSMIRSLMYLTASRPNIMFAVCACARHQVTPKECHMYAVKRIFRYQKGHLKLGLWYPKESPFDLVAYSYSDYGGAT
nr:hypothetical protein [Tanacetum cinerariifolium]